MIRMITVTRGDGVQVLRPHEVVSVSEASGRDKEQGFKCVVHLAGKVCIPVMQNICEVTTMWTESAEDWGLASGGRGNA